MNYQWQWDLFLQISPDYGEAYWLLFLKGIGWTLALSCCSWIIALGAGALVGILRTLNPALPRWFSLCYVQFFRGIPLLVQMFLWYFILPQLIAPMKTWAIETDPMMVQFVLATICLGLYTSARIAEQVRSGINALSTGQTHAAKALGLDGIQTYKEIILPQTFRIILPPLTSEAMNLIKNSSIAMTIGFAEITFRAREAGETTFAYFESFLVATLAYVLIALTANRISAALERRNAAKPAWGGGV